MTISFSYAYLKGFDRLIVSSPCVQIEVQRPRRAISPRMTMSEEVVESIQLLNKARLLFISTVSAMSSALWPVTIWSTFNIAAPLSSACRLNTPQKVQLFFFPICPTIASIVQP